MSVEKSMAYLIRKARDGKTFGDPKLMPVYETVERMASNMLGKLELHAAGEITEGEYMAENAKTIDLMKLLESYMRSYNSERFSDLG